MLHKLYLLVWLLFIGMAAHCQPRTTYHIGFKTGLNLSNLIEDNTKANFLPSYALGLALEQRFTPQISLFYELLYSRQESNIPIFNDPIFNKLAIRYAYLILPVGLRYQGKRSPFFVEAGIQAGYLLRHHQQFLPANGGTTSQATNLKSFDLGFLTGIGHRLSTHWLIEGKYYRSLSTIFTGYQGYDPITQSYVSRPPTKRLNQVISANLTYYF